MRDRRGVEALDQLCSGPGKLTHALGIELQHNATSLGSGPIVIEPRQSGATDETIVESVRIGITKAVELPWRFSLAGSRFVSLPRP
jgi:DNA-3-methyladenine glycosylase